MPYTALTVQDATQAGTTLAAAVAADVANGNSVVNTGNVIILARNTNGAATVRNVEVSVTRTVAGQPVEPIAVPIAAGATEILGRYDRADFGPEILLNADHAEVTFQAIRA